LETRVRRRTVLATGVKLAYAAPVVASSMSMHRLSGLAEGGTCDPSQTITCEDWATGSCNRVSPTCDMCSVMCGVDGVVHCIESDTLMFGSACASSADCGGEWVCIAGCVSEQGEEFGSESRCVFPCFCPK
jgi:hypothetical protein